MSGQSTVISSMATRQILADLAAVYTKATGRPVVVDSVGGVDAVKRIRAGDSYDLAILASDALSKLADDGLVVRDSLRVFAVSSTAIAVPSGAVKPATCDEATIKDLLGRARAVGLSSGPSGTHVRRLLNQWNEGAASPPRIVQAAPGVPVARLLATGEVDIGFQQLSELLGEPGIDIVGVVPTTLVPMTTFAVGMCDTPDDVVEAQALIEFLLSADAVPTKRRFGMEPGP